MSLAFLAPALLPLRPPASQFVVSASPSRPPSRPTPARMTVTSSPPSPQQRRPSSSSSSSPSAAAAQHTIVSNTGGDAPVVDLHSVEEYLALLSSCAAVNRLLVVQVHASWCRSCRALAPKVARLAREFANSTSFARIDFGDHPDLCYRLGVSSMPTFILYHGPAGEIDKFSCGPMRAHVLREKIRDSERGLCDLPDEQKQRREDGDEVKMNVSATETKVETER